MPKKKAEIAEIVEASEVHEEYKAEPVYVPVRILASKGASALVEWFVDGLPMRGFIMSTYIEKYAWPSGQVRADVLARAVPYGLDFSTLLYPVVTPEAIQEALHQHGIWTADDVRSMGMELRAAIQDVHGPILSIILNYIKGK